MPPLSLKTAFVTAAVFCSLACTRKRLDLIDERVVDVIHVVSDAGPNSTAAASTVESSTLEPLPSFGGSSGDAGPGPTFTPPAPSTTTPGSDPACPPNRPYYFYDACWECRFVGLNQCAPGYECEPGPYVCKPLCTVDRDCIFREFSLPVCDDRYRFCRGCSGNFECSPGLICSNFGQCVQPPPPPPATPSAEDAGGMSLSAPADAGPPATSSRTSEPAPTDR